MTHFTLKLQLPSGKEVRIKELTNRIYFDVLKFCENRDLHGFNNFLEETIFKDLKTLDIIDRFYILLYYRMLFVSEHVVFVSDSIEGKFKDVKYDIRNILDKIQSQYEDHSTDITDAKTGISATLGLPNTLFFNNVDDIYNTIIKSITINNTTITLDDITDAERDAILANLPRNIFYEVQQYAEKISQTLSTFILIEANEDFDIKQQEINMISNGVMMFVCSLFGGALSGFYSYMYSFTSKLQIDSNLFFTLTPVEMRLLFNLHREDAEQQQQQQQQPR
jgi:hypothetical protein